MPKIYKAKTQIQLSIYPNFDESHATIIPSLVSQFKNSSNLSGKINDDCGLGMSKIYSANNHITIKAIPSISRTLAVEVTTTPPSTADQCINSIIEYISTENQAAFKNGMNRLKKKIEENNERINEINNLVSQNDPSVNSRKLISSILLPTLLKYKDNISEDQQKIDYFNSLPFIVAPVEVYSEPIYRKVILIFFGSLTGLAIGFVLRLSIKRFISQRPRNRN